MEPDRAAFPVEAVVDSPISDSSHAPPGQDVESVVKNENSSGQDPANDGEHHYDYPTGLKLASILAGATMAYYLLFLDLAIISTATPAITTEFDALIDIGWYSGAYQLASAAFQPLSGKIYTYFSLKWTFLAFFFVFELGSAICGAAQSSPMFIIGRAIAGLGSSGLFTGCLTTVANCIPKERRPLFQAINIGIGQLGLACGPIVGGAFTTRVSWRWCFYVNLPIGAVVGLCLIFNKVPEATVKPPWRHVLGTAVKSLDLVGFALVSPAAIMLLLALEYGGNQYAWDSSVVIGLLCGAAAVFALFLFWEHREGDGAMIPFAFLRSPVVRSASLTQFFSLGGILIGDFYLAIYFQTINNNSALMSGVHLLPVTLGLVIFTFVTGGLIQVTGYYLPWILAGSAIATVGYGLMSMLSPTTTFGQWFGYLCVYGIGSGVGNSGSYIAVQNLVPLKQIPTAIAIVIFAQNLGAAVWVVVANAIFNNSLRKELTQRAALIGPSPEVIIEAGTRNIRAAGLTPSELAAVLVAYGKAIDRTMYLGIAVFGSVMLVAWEMGFTNLKEVKRQKELKNDSTPEEGMDVSSDVKSVEQGVKVDAVESEPVDNFPINTQVANPGRAKSASWSRKTDGASGTIRFNYIVDGSGRNGVISTEYLKHRKFNQGLKNQAHWAYWKNAKVYAPGTAQEGSPFFEALTDQSGWCWSIPLHDGTLSVGVVMRQDLLLKRKQELGSPGMVEFYKNLTTLAPQIQERLVDAEIVSTEIQAASDWSYSASAYAGPNFRLVGDAGCFIDPYFSSGVHLALSSALSAAMTVQAVRNGEASEFVGAKWHSIKTAEGYSRFLLVVMNALKQIRKGEELLISDVDEDGFDRAFDFFKPIIQGSADADMGGKLTQDMVSKTLDFCFNAFAQVTPDQRQAVLDKLESVKDDPTTETKQDLEKLTDDELAILRTIRARQMMRSEDAMNINTFSNDAIDGLLPRLVTGKLELDREKELAGAPAHMETLFDTGLAGHSTMPEIKSEA